MDNDTPIILAFFLLFLAGACDGTAETLKWHPGGFFHVFRNANLDFWYITDSWNNKYKDGLYENGPKFWQSTKALVFLTDGYHLMRWIKNNLTFLAAMCFFLVAFITGSPVEWYMIPIAYGLCYAAYTLGFTVIYDFLFGYKS